MLKTTSQVKSFYSLHTILIFLFLSLLCLNTAKASDKTLITIDQFISHPALDAASKGIEQAFRDRNLLEKIDLKISNPQGNIPLNAQIAKDQAALSPKFMIAIATPAAQSIFKNLKTNSTLAFVAVTSPLVAGLKEQSNVIGVSDQPPIKELLEIMSKVLPKAKNIGIIYNPGETNSVKMVDDIKQLAKEANLEIVLSTVISSSNAKQAAQKLVGKVDFIYIPQDNLVVSSLDSIIAVTNNAKIPAVSNDPSLVIKGLLLSYGCDYYKSGEQLGNMIADLIDGKKLIQNIQSTNIFELKINSFAATKLGIDMPVGIQ